MVNMNRWQNTSISTSGSKCGAKAAAHYNMESAGTTTLHVQI